MDQETCELQLHLCFATNPRPGASGSTVVPGVTSEPEIYPHNASDPDFGATTNFVSRLPAISTPS